MAHKFNPHIITTQITINHHQIFLDEEISDPMYYRSIINTITTSNPGDVLEIVLNYYGGRLDAAGAIVEAIHSCKAQVKCVVIGACMSAATLIMLACPEIHITDSARVMVHQCTFGAYGQASHVKAQVDYVHRVETRMMRDAYAGFLTFDELDELENGREFWFDADETEKRIQSRDKYLEELHAVQQHEAEETQED